MMMLSIAIPVAIISASMIAWMLGSGRSRKAATVRINSLELQLKNSQDRAAGLHKEVGTLRESMRTLDAQLATERQEKELATLELKNPLRKSSVVFATSCLAVGLLAGGAMTGLWVNSHVDMKYREKMTQLEVRAGVAETRVEYLERDRKSAVQEAQQYRRQVLEEREKRSVAVTKLEVVLEHLVAKKAGREITIDLDKMREGMKREAESKRDAAAGKTEVVAMPVPSLL